MSSYCLLYGLRVRFNQEVPGIVFDKMPPDDVELEVRLGEMPHWFCGDNPSKESWYLSKESNSNGKPRLTIWKLANGEYFQARYADGTEFLVNQSGTKVWATWPRDTLTLEDTATYLLGPIMGFVLLLRGCISLHASAVVVANKSIALVGPAGAGKSTTAAAFADLGYAVLAEDVVTLDDRGNAFLVQPAYPCIRLWPASVKALYGTRVDLPKLTPTWDKCYLDLHQERYQFRKDPVPLAAIYLIGMRMDDPASPQIKQLSTSQSLISLTANTYATYLMDKSMRARGFELLGRVVSNVPIREVIPHSNPAYIQKLCATILEDFGRLIPQAIEPTELVQPQHV